ncbi:MAG TPA: FAD-binding oxidoreductase [Terriglobia bacterium]|nr:FAD-binding oxidoreductase [Terriglobia bacterium]
MDTNGIEHLRSRLRGEIIVRGDAVYDAARRVYNGMIDKRPGLIVRCTDVGDVTAALEYARESKAVTAIRGGGHSGAGLGTCEDGLVIDLSGMKGVRVDPASSTVRVAGGCVWGEVDHATQAFGMATPSGFISTTGVAGLTLGGGIGYLTRRWGLTIDNLLSVDMVLADGRFVVASKNENPDLFWAVRGGGGNFGIVTSFEFRLHPLTTVYAGPMFWPLEQTAEVMSVYREFIVKAPEEINGFFAFLTIPPAPMFPRELHLRKVCGIMWCCTGLAAEADAALKPMRSVGKPLLDHVGEIPFLMVQNLFDALYPPGLQWYWRADFVNELSDKAIELHAEHGAKLPTMHSTMHLYPIDGAAHRVARNETAFSYRDANWAEVIVGVDPDPANRDKITNWCKDYFDALHPHSAGGAYVNFMMEEGQERVRAAFRDNYDRLAAIKRKYDPTNFFHVNQNIQPAGARPIDTAATDRLEQKRPVSMAAVQEGALQTALSTGLQNLRAGDGPGAITKLKQA